MEDKVNGLFAIAGALIFLAFSPLDAPGGTEVAIGGALVCAIAAILFFVRNRG